MEPESLNSRPHQRHLLILFGVSVLGALSVLCFSGKNSPAEELLQSSTVVSKTAFNNSRFQHYKYEITLTKEAVLNWEWDKEMLASKPTSMSLSPGSYSFVIFRNFNGDQWVGYDFLSEIGRGAIGNSHVFAANTSVETVDRAFTNLVTTRRNLSSEKTPLLATADGNRLHLAISE